MQSAVFTTLGLFSVSQELSGMVMAHLHEADPEVVAEESLCLAATATARAIEATSSSGQNKLSESVLLAPFLYRDYLVGSAMLETEDAATADLGAEIGERLERKSAFYGTQLPKATLPTGTLLKNAMLLWMGRISPPGMPNGPEERLEASGAIDRMRGHVRLIAAHIRHVETAD